MTAGEIEGVGEEEVDGRSTVDICLGYLCLNYFYHHGVSPLVVLKALLLILLERV